MKPPFTAMSPGSGKLSPNQIGATRPHSLAVSEAVKHDTAPIIVERNLHSMVCSILLHSMIQLRSAANGLQLGRSVDRLIIVVGVDIDIIRDVMQTQCRPQFCVAAFVVVRLHRDVELQAAQAWRGGLRPINLSAQCPCAQTKSTVACGPLAAVQPPEQPLMHQ